MAAFHAPTEIEGVASEFLLAGGVRASHVECILCHHHPPYDDDKCPRRVGSILLRHYLYTW